VEAPLDRSSTWPYEDGEPGRFSYVRADHPTGVACEEALGALDGGHALLYPSGMGAVTSVLLTMLHSGGQKNKRIEQDLMGLIPTGPEKSAVQM